MRTRVKICCVASASEVRAAAVAGADAIGAVGPMPSGPGSIDDETARAVIEAAPPGVTPVLLTQEYTPEEVVLHIRVTRAPVVQLVRHVDPRLHGLIREALPHVKIIQVVHVQNEAALEFARGYAKTADALLLDSGKPDDPVEETLGGTGQAHDWQISRQIVSVIEKPIWLAGGLTQGNVVEAIDTVRPFGIDLCSGVRTMGKLDQRKLTGLFATIRAHDRNA